MSPVAAPARTRWSAVLLGAVSGSFAILIISQVAYILTALIYRTGWVPDNLSGWIGLALSFFAGQFLAGYVGGRLSRSPYAGAHGGMAAACCHAIFAVIILLRGSPAGIVVLVSLGAAAVAVGYGGGKVAGRRYRTQREKENTINGG